MVQIPGPGLKVGENLRGLPGGCWCLELTDALLSCFGWKPSVGLLLKYD